MVMLLGSVRKGFQAQIRALSDIIEFSTLLSNQIFSGLFRIFFLFKLNNFIQNISNREMFF